MQDPSVYAMNGKSVEIDNTDAEGRLVLAGVSISVQFVLVSWLEPIGRCHLLHNHWVQATHSDWCRDFDWVGDYHSWPCFAISDRNPSACVIALGEVYSAVYSACSSCLCREDNETDYIPLDLWWTLGAPSRCGGGWIRPILAYATRWRLPCSNTWLQRRSPKCM